MTHPDRQHDEDDRFPSGEWNGFFIQPDSRRRHAMELVLEFAEGHIGGQGADNVGEFTLSGKYDPKSAECSWTKQYIGQHCVQYSGEASERGIIGQWKIEGAAEAWSGPFFVWPRASGNSESAFERLFVEYELSFTFEPPDPEGEGDS